MLFNNNVLLHNLKQNRVPRLFIFSVIQTIYSRKFLHTKMTTKPTAKPDQVASYLCWDIETTFSLAVIFRAYEEQERFLVLLRMLLAEQFCLNTRITVLTLSPFDLACLEKSLKNQNLNEYWFDFVPFRNYVIPTGKYNVK